ncbi:EAL domain-containing protein [Inhella gelatinilytica]|uniref:EAL domain-containing protein n=1 Tax=Inhella gelatinilytica TaxID=2795030 RepID=A0A931ND85_9BURK|nr:EAL domain-containing protein [Inhella gelatinilytica]MBH9551975.1 EAL domain-containing protein [Inhella gelatinilytica]
MSLEQRVVLALDDDPLYLDILVEQLQAIGVGSVLPHTRAVSALHDLTQQHVDVVISDLDMPETDGPRFLHQLADLRLPIQVLLISGTRPDLLASVVEFGRSLGLHMAGSLPKPAELDPLEAILLQCDATKPRPAQTLRQAVDNHTDLDKSALERALQDGSIRPWYQPKLDANGLQVIGVEALARWLPHEGPAISPARFVPAMEAAGLSWNLFTCMLTHVLRDLAAWKLAGWPMRAAVNLSMDCTDRLDLPEEVFSRSRAAGVALEDLTIEVTESRLMANRSAALETLNRLALMRVKLSIDDFGTGYSSLSQLADLPFSELKIDGSFVKRLGTDQKIDRIVQATASFGAGLGMDLVAEGVEEHSQLRALRRLGVDQIQGYLFARPMPEPEFRHWLSRWRPGHMSGSLNKSPPQVLAVGPGESILRGWLDTLARHLPHLQGQWATTEPEAIRLMALASPDLLMVDARDHPEQAWSLAERLRQRCPATRLVIVTPALDEVQIARANEADATLASHPMGDVQVEHWVHRVLEGLHLAQR